MIDLNDPQLDKNGQLVPLLTNQTFKDRIEEYCRTIFGNSSLKDANYIHQLDFSLNLASLYDKTKPIER
jgi:hypothetical protein